VKGYKRNRPFLTEAQHRELGALIANLEDALNDYSCRVPKCKARSLMDTARRRLGLLRCEMENEMFRDCIPEPADPLRVYYGRASRRPLQSDIE
jgi:hypothetical protein